MGSGLKISGFVILFLGLLLSVGSVVMAFSAMTIEHDEVLVADGSDFVENDEGDYEYEIYATGDFHIRITSRSTTQVVVDIIVEDRFEETKINLQGRTTPLDETVEMESYEYKYLDITIHFIDETTMIDHVNVEIYETMLSDEAALMCCFGTIIPVFGVIMIIVGIILVIVGFTRSGKNDTAQTPVYNQPGTGSYGGYPPQTGSYGGYQSQTGSYGGYPSQTGSYGGYPSQTGSYGGYPSQSGYGGTGYGGQTKQGSTYPGRTTQRTTTPPSYGARVGHTPTRQPGSPKMAPPPPGTGSNPAYGSSRGNHIRTDYNSSTVYDMKVEEYPRSNR